MNKHSPIIAVLLLFFLVIFQRVNYEKLEKQYTETRLSLAKAETEKALLKEQVDALRY